MRRGIALSLLLAACAAPAVPSSKPVPAPFVPPPAEKPTFADGVACRYGFGAPDTLLVPDGGAIGSAVAASIGTKTLVAYVETQHQALGARIFDSVTKTTPLPIVLGEERYSAQVYAVNDHFVIAWTDRQERWSAQIVKLDGSLGPVVRVPLADPKLTLVPLGEQLLALGHDEPHGTLRDCALHAQLLGPNLEASGKPTTMAERGMCVGTSVAKRIGDEVWFGFHTFDVENRSAHTRLARLDANGRLLEPPFDIGPRNAVNDRFDFIPSPRGALAVFGTKEEHDAPIDTVAMTLDAHGRTSGAPAEIGHGDEHGGLVQLFDVHGRPVLGMHGAEVVPLDWSGAALGPPTKLAPFARSGTWTSIGGERVYLWTDFRHAHDEVYSAPLACGGTTRTAQDFAPLVDTQASAPPPPVPHACTHLHFVQDVPIAEQPEYPTFARRGDELLVGWTTGDGRFDFYTRRVSVKTGAPLDEGTLVTRNGRDGAFVVDGADTTLVSSSFYEISAMKLRPDSTADPRTREVLSPPFATKLGIVTAFPTRCPPIRRSTRRRSRSMASSRSPRRDSRPPRARRCTASTAVSSRALLVKTAAPRS